mmetsp:Transcript_26938/g.56400  ORF Transcript_26938/g.56400 Transcript_26938/m.56400 type:complete len:320 (+) Transcript_26938:96-1055(+)
MRAVVLPTLIVQTVFLQATIRSVNVAAMATAKVIDSHLHVWANQQESQTFPYTQAPPEELQDRASTAELLQQMDQNGIDGALIVQPINHKYDHSYVLEATQTHPNRLKGMLLHDPSLNEHDAVQQLENLALKGFVGVRFNPYLWPKMDDDKWSPMSEGAGLAVYKRCAELRMPVGVMCFQGLDLHYDDIVALLQKSPETVLVLDHFAFTSVVDKPENFEKLLALAQYNNVHVKISALFRLGDESPSFERVRTERFLPLLKAYGADRLLYGSDFPFVLEQKEAYGMVNVVSSWIENETEKAQIMGGTAEKLFGPWGYAIG